jgi:hypothetical protein
MEMLSSKVGLVLLVVGVMHFFNVFVIAKLGRRLSRFLRPQEDPAQSDEPEELPTPPRTTTSRF